MGGPEYNGLPLINFDHLFENKIKINGYWVPSKEDYFVQLLFQGALKYDPFRDSYCKEIFDLVSEVDQKKVRRLGESCFSHVGLKAVDMALSGRTKKTISLKWQLIIRNLRQHPKLLLPFLWSLFIHWQIIYPARNFLRQTPLIRTPVIAVTGPDGAGKSTLTSNLRRTLEQNGYNVKQTHLGIYNTRTKILSLTHTIYNRITGYSWDEEQKAIKKGTRKIPDRKSRFKGCILLTDATIRYLKAQSSDADVIIGDRYIHDVGMYAQMGRLSRLFNFFEREPFKGFFLTAKPEDFAYRSEYTIDSLKEMIERYDKLDLNFETLDASKDPDEVFKDLLESAFKKEEIMREF